jgi:TatD DNase family protein
MRLVDTHCHLDFSAFADDLDQVLENAEAAGVFKIINPAIDLESSRRIIDLADKNKQINVAVGVHPTNSLTWDHHTKENLTELLNSQCVVAIGEIGLDYYWEDAPPHIQRSVFLEQLQLAADNNLPVIIHNRDATADIMDILEDYVIRLRSTNPMLALKPGVLHSFSASISDALKAVENQFMIGITGPVTFKKAEELQHIVSEIPVNSLLVETDAPFLSPHPYRGKRNEPAYVRLVAEKIAAIKNLDVEQVATQTTINAEKLFAGRGVT